MEFLDELGVTGIPAITVICFLAAEVLKQLPIPSKLLPTICGCLGCVLGAVAMFALPDYPDGNLFTALATGIVSGFAATGVHQGVHQMRGKSTSAETTTEI